MLKLICGPNCCYRPQAAIGQCFSAMIIQPAAVHQFSAVQVQRAINGCIFQSAPAKFIPIAKKTLKISVMSRNFFLVTTSILLVALSACATAPPSQNEVRDVPSDQIYYVSPSRSVTETTQIIVTRDKGALGSANFLHFYIDGQKAASLNTAEKVELTVPKGEHVFGVKPTDPFGLSSIFSMDQDLKPGRVYRYRLIHTPSGSRIHREPDIAPNN